MGSFEYAKVKKEAGAGIYKKWRQSIIEKYENKCQRCGKRFKKGLCVHPFINIKEDPSRLMDEGNVIVFCRKCHSLFHGRYGYENNKKQNEEFIERYKIVRNLNK